MATPQTGGTQAQVVSMLDVPAVDPQRLGKMDVLVTYRTDPIHSFTIRLPAEGMTGAKLDAAIRSDYAARKELLNRTVSV